MVPLRAIIIGAGLGGLTLLHGLRAAGVDARVYERSPRHGAQPASYGIHLNADGLAALHASLPATNWAMVDAAGVPAPNIVRFRDPVAAHPQHARQALPRARHRPRHQAARHQSRQAPPRAPPRHRHQPGGEPLVHWGTRFTHYETTPDGVRAHFEDGTHADGDLLVGADGSNSRVRHQLLPQVQRHELGITNIAGRVPLSGAVAAALPADLTDGGINNIVPPGSGWMFLSTWDTGDPDVPDVSGGAGRYVIWAWAGARAPTPTTWPASTEPALKQLVQQRTHRWAQPLQILVDQTDPATVTTVPLRSMPQLPLWDRPRSRCSATPSTT